MQSMIDIIAQACPCELTANRGTSLRECAVYDYYSTSWDGVKRGIMLKISVFAATMQRAAEIQSAIECAIVTAGDNPLTQTVLTCRQNGGGWLIDGDRHCRISYFEIVIKDANVKGV